MQKKFFKKYCTKVLADVTKEIDLISAGINNNDELRGIEIAYDAFTKCLERSVNEGIQENNYMDIIAACALGLLVIVLVLVPLMSLTYLKHLTELQLISDELEEIRNELNRINEREDRHEEIKD